MTEIINIDGRDIKFKATGSTLRRYRDQFNRDLFEDFNKLTTEDLSGDAMVIMQNLAFIMAKQGDDNGEMSDDINDWLDSFESFPFNEVAPKIVQLWQKSNITTVQPKNTVSRRKGN
jgi:hypothetical protein